MRERQSFSKEFKDAIRSRILNRGNKTISEICEDAGVNLGTASKWVKLCDTSLEMKKNKSSTKWSAEQKLKALIDTASMSEAELGAYLRREGLFSNQLDEWKSEIITSLKPTKKLKKMKDERDHKIKGLEREILRKDRALAEATALLILQKKVNLIWGNKDEDEE